MKETKFKQTEVGMIPSDWDYAVFGNLVYICRGGSPRPIDAYITSNPSGINWIKIGDVAEGDKYITSTKERIIPEGKKSSREVHSGDFILSNSMSFGRPYILKIDGCIHDGWLAIQNYQDTFDTNFLYYLLSSENVYAQYVSMAAGSSVQNLNKEKVAAVKLSFPSSKKEQQRIANALSDVDSLIANLEKLIAKKKNIKQGAMQQLLTGKKRLPGFAPDERTGSRPADERRKECHSERSAKREVEESSGNKMTELGMIPSDWEVKTFGELFDILPNNTLSRAELNEDSGLFKNVHYGDVLVKFQEWIDCSKNTLPFINSDAKFNHTTLQDGDVIIADTAEDETVGKSTEIYNVGKLKVVSGLHTIPIRPQKRFASKWLGYFINSACWHDQILPFITGTKVSAISKAAVAETKFFYPAKTEEQTAIANVLSDMDTEISALETKLAKYRTLKTGMMQQLLTGKVRLI